jgi:hypothetical protein
MKGLGIIAAAALCAPVFLAQAQTSLDAAPTVAGPGMMSPADAAPTVAKVFTFKQTTQGACVLQNGTLSFDSAGNGTVKLATMTTDKDDDAIWKARVRLRNVAGTSVFTSPELNSPKMENKDGHPQTYQWSYSFHIDPTLLTSATLAEMVEITC